MTPVTFGAPGLCPRCQCQLPPYDYDRYLPFCQMQDHWLEEMRADLVKALNEEQAKWGVPASDLIPSELSSTVVLSPTTPEGVPEHHMSVQYSLISSGDDEFVTAFIPGDVEPLVASKSGHARFNDLLDALRAKEPVEVIRNLFSVAKAVAEKFEQVSERVIVNGGTVLFDGAPVDNSITKQIVRFLEEGSDFRALVSFMENVNDNPNEHSRVQLYDWLNSKDFTITADGMIVGYKGVSEDGEYGYRSISSGREPVYVTVDGETKQHTGRIPNPVGAVITMDRGLVQHDPSVGCHVGLHVGTYDYAKSFSHGTVLEVHVNPRDVVSVPTDCSWAKVRTCRYEVVDAISEPYGSGLIDPDGFYDEPLTWDEWEDDFSEEEEDGPLAEGDWVKVTTSGNLGGKTGEIVRVANSGFGSTFYVEFDDPYAGPLAGNQGAFGEGDLERI